MNKNSKRLGLYIILLLLIATAAVTLRTLACINNMEGDLIYFDDDSLFFASAIVVIAGSFLLLTSSAVLHKVSLKASFSSPLTYVPTGAVCVALTALAATLISDAMVFTSYLPFSAALREPLFILNAACAILSALSLTHFILTAVLTERHRQLRAYFALGTIVFASLYAITLYFDRTMPINAPTEIVDEMAYLLVAIFFLYEARISLGRELWRGYCAFGLTAALLTAYASIPELLVYFIDGRTLALSIESSMLLFALFIFIFARLIIAATVREDCEHRSIGILREFAERREAELAEATKLRRGIVDMQITIDDILGEPVETITVNPEGIKYESETNAIAAEPEYKTAESNNEPIVAEITSDSEDTVE